MCLQGLTITQVYAVEVVSMENARLLVYANVMLIGWEPAVIQVSSEVSLLNKDIKE